MTPWLQRVGFPGSVCLRSTSNFLDQYARLLYSGDAGRTGSDPEFAPRSQLVIKSSVFGHRQKEAGVHFHTIWSLPNPIILYTQKLNAVRNTF